MINKNLKDVTQEDILNLISNSIAEGKTLDYKEEFKLDRENEKGEFLADLCSFANTDGGDLIFGVKEEGGVAIEISGVNIVNLDDEKLKIENLIRDAVSSRISLDFKEITIENKKVLIIRIKKSWNSPIRVTYNPYSKTKDQFYARHSSGKYALDVSELKKAFILSQSITDKIKNFREKRISEIYSNTLPFNINEGPKIILHIVPLVSMTGDNNSLDLNYGTFQSKIKPMRAHGYGNRINLEGFLSFDEKEGITRRYTQLFKNGIIEATDTTMLLSDNSIPIGGLEGVLIEYLDECLKYLAEIGISLPIYVFLTLTGVNGFILKIPDFLFSSDYKIDRDVLILSESTVTNINEKAEHILKPIFDEIWNTCGYSGSMYYDEKGNRKK